MCYVYSSKNCSCLDQGAECLIEVGADVNTGNGPETPLYYAVNTNNEIMVELLLKHVRLVCILLLFLCCLFICSLKLSRDLTFCK